MFGARNPFAQTHDDTAPRVGGVDGVATDWVRWYPPDTPFKWGQGFPVPYTGAAMNFGGRWLNQFLPDKEFEVPPEISYQAYAYPVAAGTSGAFQSQLGGAVAHPVTGRLTSTIMDAYGRAQQQAAPGPLEALAGSFWRS